MKKFHELEKRQRISKKLEKKLFKAIDELPVNELSIEDTYSLHNLFFNSDVSIGNTMESIDPETEFREQ